MNKGHNAGDVGSAKADFSDLLQSAEQITAEFEPADFADLPRVERNLAQLVEAGRQLYSKTGKDVGAQDVKASILLGSRGIDLPNIRQQLENLTHTGRQIEPSKAFEPLEPLRDTDIAGFLRNERENALLSVIEETRKETFDSVERMHWDSTVVEWEGEKQKVLQALAGGGANAMPSDSSNLSRSVMPEVSQIHETTLGKKSALDNQSMAYANEIMHYNTAVSTSGTKLNLTELLSSLFPEEKDAEACAMWDMVKSMSTLSPSAMGIAMWRNKEATKNAIVLNARFYLERSFIKFVRNTVFSNLQQAQLGGALGITQLIKSFLSINVSSNTPGLADGSIDGAPVWGMIYYCLRCGEIQAAINVASQAGPGLQEMVTLLSELSSSPDKRLTPHSENAVRLGYRRSIRSTTDPFKRAVYCILGACDPSDEHSEIANSLDDYLWIKLCQVRGETSLDVSTSSITGNVDQLTLNQLQILLSEEYGENHFNGFEQPLLYFQVLFLTGQFEEAVEFLFRVERFRSHAVHVALAMFVRNMLMLSTNVQAALLTKEADKMKRLNLARMIMLYVRRFETTDPKEALHYFYFLRSIRGTKNENLFMSCVSELVLESREFDLLLGSLSPEGIRTLGLIDRLHSSSSESQKIIESVASYSEQKGMLEDSVALNDLAGKHEKAVDLMNKLLSQIVSAPAVGNSQKDRLQRQAVVIAKRYRTLGHQASNETMAAFYLQLDLITFFDLYHAKKFDEALDTIEKIKIVPLAKSDVDIRISSFRILGDEIRRNIPDILLACMTILFSQYKQLKTVSHGRGLGQESGRKTQLQSLKEKANSLIAFAGMIPYRMPGDTNGRLVQMEVLMN